MSIIITVAPKVGERTLLKDKVLSGSTVIDGVTVRKENQNG